VVTSTWYLTLKNIGTVIRTGIASTYGTVGVIWSDPNDPDIIDQYGTGIILNYR